MVWWDDTHRSLCLVKLTVCFESNFDNTAQRKTAKYTDIVDRAKLSDYGTTIQIGSRGAPHFSSFKALATAINMSSKELSQLLHRVTRVALSRFGVLGTEYHRTYSNLL